MMPLDFDIQGMIGKTPAYRDCQLAAMPLDSNVQGHCRPKTMMPLDSASRAKVEISANSDCQLAMMPLDFDVQSYH